MIPKDLPKTLADVPVALTRVANQLAVGNITRGNANNYLSNVLQLDLWNAFPEDHTDTLRSSWVQLFDSQEEKRDQATNSDTHRSTPRNGADFSRSQNMTACNTPELNSKENPQCLTREVLARAEKRRVDSTMPDNGNARIDVTKYDFVADSGGTGVPVNMHPDAVKTLVKTEYYCRSIHTAISTLLLQLRKPEFPTLLWDNLLQNEFVDLNMIYSHLYEIAKLSIGDHTSFMNTSTSPSPTRKIRTFGEWSYAWATYRRAVVFVFNHRADEMEHWYTFISQIFQTTNETRHGSAIKMEATMRYCIFGNQSRCLWDHHEVMHLQHAYLGLGATQNRPNKRSNSGESLRPTKKNRPRGWSGEICCRFNQGGMNACRQSGCIYEHRCLRCNGDHGAYACTQSSLNGPRVQ